MNSAMYVYSCARFPWADTTRLGHATSFEFQQTYIAHELYIASVAVCISDTCGGLCAKHFQGPNSRATPMAGWDWAMLLHDVEAASRAARGQTTCKTMHEYCFVLLFGSFSS